MASRSLVACALVVAILLGSLASKAGAKEGVEARVLTPISREASAGSRITVVWTLTFVGEGGTRRPFGGGYVFVRLFGPDGSKSARVYAENPRAGRFRAVVRVPRGGVRRVELGIMGTVCGAKGRPACHPSPKLFPIVGSPFS